ncbi:hypothetical protein ABK040_001873 [Willaertia magna]
MTTEETMATEETFNQLLISWFELPAVQSVTVEDLLNDLKENDNLNYDDTILFKRYKNYKSNCGKGGTLKIMLTNLENYFKINDENNYQENNFINFTVKPFLLDELWMNVALFLKDSEVLNLALCCKEFYELFFVKNLYFWKLKLQNRDVYYNFVKEYNYLEFYKLFKQKELYYPLNNLKPINLKDFIQQENILQNLPSRICFMNGMYNYSNIGILYINSNYIIDNDEINYEYINCRTFYNQFASFLSLGTKLITIVISINNINHLNIINNSFVNIKNMLLNFAKRSGFNIQTSVLIKVIDPFTLKGIIKNPLTLNLDQDSMIDKLNNNLNLMDDLNFFTSATRMGFPSDKNLRASILHVLTKRVTLNNLTVMVGVSSGILKKENVQLVTKDKVLNARITRINKCISNSKELFTEEVVDRYFGRSSHILSVDICVTDNILMNETTITSGVLIYQKDEVLIAKSSATIQVLCFEVLKQDDILLLSGTQFDLFCKVKEIKELVNNRTGRSTQQKPLQIGKNEAGIVEIEFINKTVFNPLEVFSKYSQQGRLIVRSIPPEILQNIELNDITMKILKEMLTVSQESERFSCLSSCCVKCLTMSKGTEKKLAQNEAHKPKPKDPNNPAEMYTFLVSLIPSKELKTNTLGI